MLYRQLGDQQAAPPTILNSGAKNILTKAYVQLAPFLDQTNTKIKVKLYNSGEYYNCFTLDVDKFYFAGSTVISEQIS